eukprot:1191464-Prorocentrum_minimum.AAC.3
MKLLQPPVEGGISGGGLEGHFPDLHRPAVADVVVLQEQLLELVVLLHRVRHQAHALVPQPAVVEVDANQGGGVLRVALQNHLTQPSASQPAQLVAAHVQRRQRAVLPNRLRTHPTVRVQPPHASDGQDTACAHLRRSGYSLRTPPSVRIQPPHTSDGQDTASTHIQPSPSKSALRDIEQTGF